MPLIVYLHGHGLGDNIDDLKMKNILLPCGKEERRDHPLIFWFLIYRRNWIMAGKVCSQVSNRLLWN